MMIQSPSPAWQMPCMPWSTDPKCLVHNPITKTITNTVDFMKDPAGYIASKLQQADESLASNVLPALVKALHPDLSAHWFVEAYKVSFAAAVILWGVLLGWQFVQYGRRRVGPEELMETVVQYTPMFFLGAAFGPAVGNVLLRLVGALCESIISWNGQGSMGKDATKFAKLISGTNPDVMVGGTMVVIVIFAVMMVGFLVVLVGLLFMFVTLYISGSVFPVGWAWITKSEGREHGFKILRVWLGVLAAQPIMFMALHVAMSMVSAGWVGDVGDASGKSKPLAVLMALLGGTLALLMVAATPFGLAKMMPIGPSQSSASGPSLSGWGGKGSKSSSFGRGGAGADSDTDSQMGQLSRAGGPGGGGQPGGGPGSGGSLAGAEAGAAGTGVGLAAVAAKKGVDKAKETGQEAARQGQDAADDAGGGDQGAAGGTSTGGSVADATNGGGDGAVDGDESGEQSESDGGARGRRGGLVGAAASAASGVGGAAGGLGAAVDKGSSLAQTVAQHTGDHMDHQHADPPRSRR